MIISSQQVSNIIKLQSVFKKQKVNETVAPSKTDILELSARVQELKLAKEMVLKFPDVRADKILELKKRIQEGTYQVSGEEVAAKMINRSLVDELVRR